MLRSSQFSELFQVLFETGPIKFISTLGNVSCILYRLIVCPKVCCWYFTASVTKSYPSLIMVLEAQFQISSYLHLMECFALIHYQMLLNVHCYEACCTVLQHEGLMMLNIKLFVVSIIMRTVSGYLQCVTWDGWGDSTQQNLLLICPICL